MYSLSFEIWKEKPIKEWSVLARDVNVLLLLSIYTVFGLLQHIIQNITFT